MSALYAVTLLGSFMHAAPRQENTAELAVGGLAALAPQRLAAIAWYPQGREHPMQVLGRLPTGDALPLDLAGPLSRFCSQLPLSQPSRHTAGQLPARLRVTGIESMLAVPLRMSTECLGFFLIGGPDPCFRDDVTFVQALGAQASTALYVSRTRKSEAEHVRELDAVTEELREKGELLSRASKLQEGLLDLVLNGCGTATIVKHLSEEIGTAVWLVDPAGRVLHAVDGDSQPALPPGLADLPSFIERLRRGGKGLPVEIPSPDGGPATLVESVATDSEVFGYLLAHPSDIGQFGQLLLQGGRLVLALRLLIERSITEAEERAGRDLIQDALLLHRGGHTSMAVATRLGYDHDGPAVVMAVRVHSPRQGSLGMEEARRATEREVRDEVRAHTTGLVGLIGEEIVVVVRPEAADGCSRRLLERLTSSPIRAHGIGISDPHTSLGDLETAYREALTAAAVSERIAHKIVRFADLGLYRLFFNAQHADRVDAYIDRWLEPLLCYDAGHHTSLVETLACHLSGGPREEVAAKLSIHPSTLKYRLRRIREILGLDFVDAESRFNIELALRLVQVTRDLRASGQG